jgi:hypothetical protein
MSLCSSGIIVAAFSTSLLLADILYLQTDKLIPHLFLGAITTSLFFVLCQNGYEMVNWAVLLAIPVYMISSWIIRTMRIPRVSTTKPDEDDCPVCREPPRRNECIKPKPKCSS